LKKKAQEYLGTRISTPGGRKSLSTVHYLPFLLIKPPVLIE